MNQTVIIGNLTADPVVRVNGDNQSRTTCTVAVNEGTGENEKTHFLNVTAFGTLGENMAASLHKGQRVVVVGRLNTYSKEVEIDGEEKRVTMTSITAYSVAPDLRWAVARVSKVIHDAASDADEADEAPAKATKATRSTKATQSAKATRPVKVVEVAEDDDDEF